ncbi:MAG: GNAT family N-acetyltransferase [Clostridia bacterium]|nr:GNAT family N-acetyltransferase [Clostridia bacterium]
MQKLSDPRHPERAEYESLKQLWLKCFDDEKTVVDRFFKYAVIPENTVAVFDGSTAVSVLYMLQSTVKSNSKNYKALYIYAVCTHPDYRGMGLMKGCFDFLFDISKKRGVDYLFLVPASEDLFKMYEGLGFKKGFYYSKNKFFSKDFTSDVTKHEGLTFDDYIKIRNSFSKITLATLDERGFNAFLSPEGECVKAIKVGNGYGVYEIEGGAVTVHELFGDEKSILQVIFNLTKVDFLELRGIPQKGNSVPFGMYLALNDAPPIENAFFGIPYGG